MIQKTFAWAVISLIYIILAAVILSDSPEVKLKIMKTTNSFSPDKRIYYPDTLKKITAEMKITSILSDAVLKINLNNNKIAEKKFEKSIKFVHPIPALPPGKHTLEVEIESKNLIGKKFETKKTFTFYIAEKIPAIAKETTSKKTVEEVETYNVEVKFNVRDFKYKSTATIEGSVEGKTKLYGRLFAELNAPNGSKTLIGTEDFNVAKNKPFFLRFTKNINAEFGPGEYEVVIRAITKYESIELNKKIRLENKPPSVEIKNIDFEPAFRDYAIIDVIADDDAGIKEVNLIVNNNSNITKLKNPEFIDNTYRFKVKINPGENEFEALAIDVFNEKSTSLKKQITFVIEK